MAEEIEEALTPGELAAIELTVQLWNALCGVVGTSSSRGRDLAELCRHIHAIQHTILAQAAARAYPERFPLLGEILVGRDIAGSPM